MFSHLSQASAGIDFTSYFAVAALINDQSDAGVVGAFSTK